MAQAPVSVGLSFIPSHLERFISSYVNVTPDGHCGFHAIALSLGRDQADHLTIRAEMLQELKSHHVFYTEVEQGRVSRLEAWTSRTFDEVCSRLDTQETRVTQNMELWLAMPDFIGIIANTYNRPVFFYTALRKNERVCYPCFSVPNDDPPIIILHHINHFYHIVLDFKLQPPIPPICRIWRRYVTKTKPESSSKAWASKYHDMKDLYEPKKGVEGIECVGDFTVDD